MRDKVTDYLDKLQALLDTARERYDQENGDDVFHSAMAATELARLQRVSGHALHAAVTAAHDAGMPWRSLAAHVQVPSGTLHRQWKSGHRIVVSDPATPTTPEFL